MTVTTIPSCSEYKCDVCGKTVGKTGGKWAVLNLKQAALDYQGEPCADGSVRLDLCPPCRDRIVAAINSVKVP